MYEISATWSGFALDFPIPGNGVRQSETCWEPAGFMSGVTYAMWVWRAPGDTALDLYFFPDGFSPAYIFQFR